VGLLLVAGGQLFARGKGAETSAAAGTTARPTSFKEAPMLAQLVSQGKLPRLDQRIPKEPMVRPVIEKVGDYGGTLYVFHRGPDPWQDVGDMTEISPNYFRQDWDGSLEPAMMTSYELAADYKSIVLHIRPGMRWSDGDPIDVNDFLFLYNDMFLNEDVEMWNFLGGPIAGADRIDDLTFRLRVVEPLPNLAVQFAGPAGGSWVGIAPFDYLKQWHITYNKDANALAKQEGYETWDQAFHAHYWWNPTEDLKRPTIHPWVLSKADSVQKVLDRNPYYFVVDPQGNQLPYIDQVVGAIVDPATYDLKIISGESDIAYLFTTFENYALYKQNEASGGYKVYLVPGLLGSEMALQLNWNINDPVKKALFQNKNFRIALSVAIDRNEINSVIFAGQGKPRQATVPSSFVPYNESWARSHAEYDVAQAHRLLDQAGLNKRGSDGFRLAPNGSALQLTINHQNMEIGSSRGQLLELIKEYWEAVGIKTQLRNHESAFFWEMSATDTWDVLVRAYEKIMQHVSASTESNWAPLWGAWLDAKYAIDAGTSTLADFGGKMPGEEPPQWIKDHDAKVWQAIRTPEGSAEYNKLINDVLGAQADNLFWIGTVGEVPNPIVAKNRIGNVMTQMTPRSVWPGQLSEQVDQLFVRK
jgi:peptide/nickel transport system substrate-binding protein